MTEFASPADGVSMVEVNLEELERLEAEVLDASGRQRCVPASVYAQYDASTISGFCVRHGIYGLVTTELVAFIREHINNRTAIEIGSGDGVLADSVGILGTDNYQMERPEIRREYERFAQAPTKYGPRVRKLEGDHAVEKYSPQVIVASWLTHKYLPTEHERGGNMYAPDELNLLANCETLIFVGNTSAHARHRLLGCTHECFYEPWLYSRAWRGKNFIGVWKGGKG